MKNVLQKSKKLVYNSLKEEELQLFILLKNEIAAKMSSDFSMSSSDITDWKGDDIVIFQEALLKEVKGQISSKWFYTHMKTTGKSLPRIDVLNLLAQFVNYENWADFKTQKSSDKKTQGLPKKSKLLLILLSIILVVLIPFINSNNEFYTISVIDFDTNQPPENPIEFEHLMDGESGKPLFTDSLGIIKLPVTGNLSQLVIKSPYYKEDTLTRKINQEGGEIFKIKTDDFALMVHYFSKSKVKDWKRRRRMLSHIFHDKAEINEVFKGSFGIEKYNKTEFINKLTLPLSSLETLEVLSTERREGKIYKMRVRQQ